MSIRGMLVLAVVALASSPVLAQDYEVRMHRPGKVGDSYEGVVSGSMSQNMTVSAQGRVLKEDKSSFKARLEGTFTVLEVDERGRSKKVRWVVSMCALSEEGGASEREVLPRGAEVIAALEGDKVTYRVDGQPASKDAAKVLDLLVSISKAKHTDDDIFGTKGRKKVGDSWPMNGALAAEDLNGDGMKVDPESIKGTVRVDGVELVDGVECLKISATMALDKVAIPVPPGMAVEKADVSMGMSGNLPVDTALPRLSDSMKMQMKLVAKGKPQPDAPEITMTMDASRSKEEKLKKVK